jgi:hypothetical protein
VDEVAAGSFLRREPPEIKGSGYVVRSLEAALWAFSRSMGFEEGALLAVNLGDDADTTGRFTASSRVPTTAWRASPRSGGGSSLSGPRSRSSRTGYSPRRRGQPDLRASRSKNGSSREAG